ncbi:ferrous iron transport protein B [Halothiobacillus diazotrophicus]|uniref:Ferrous iron transport protein B n=1 Tax=Halothiobacillus diazotrophicus TaxID=1860122 RepID=A0A191ZEJ5_9GAMM|nr:Fe(2+) transporter permease subunit FeoB [Halothiobacillus diazotrophicus]ANJ66280.1 ferrous iron transport protein B [Halothiobacillus diazotrophicus]
MATFTVGMIGNPNCGKTTLFNALTGLRQKVGNWPGVTVERKTGAFEIDGNPIELVDLPGTYSLDASSSASLDEIVAREFALSHEADVIVNIVDASNLERNLYLTAQLMEMRVPLILAVNMLDLAEEAGISVDCDEMARRLGCPVVPVTATRKTGLDELKRQLLARARHSDEPGIRIEYAPLLETALRDLMSRLEPIAQRHRVDARWLGVKLLEQDRQAEALADEPLLAAVAQAQEQIRAHLDEEADVFVADARYTFIHGVVQACVKRRGQLRRSLTDRIDAVVLNRFLGIPIFLLVMYLLFVMSFNGGGIFSDFFEQSAQAIFVDGVGHLLQLMHAPDWLITLLSTTVGGAIQLVAAFIAPIGMTFLFLSILEDSGYMARAAFVMDRFMRRIGLPGKAFVPMIVGFGCNVPAVMATRTLEDPRERLISALMQPFMSCSARLVIYMAFVAVFFKAHGGQVVFGLYLLGIVVAILTALLLKRTALKGEATPFVMELPTYHIPTLKGLMLATWERLSVFILRVGKVIIVASTVVTLLSSFSLSGRPVAAGDIENSVLGQVGKVVTPLFHPMGVTDENWPAAIGLFSGVVAKEIVMGTMNGVYSRMDAGDAAAARQANPSVEPPAFDLWQSLGDAVATIPANAATFAHGFFDPLGFSSLEQARDSNLQQVAAQQNLDTTTLSRMASLFTVPAALAYLIFVLLYMPCISTMAALYRETRSRAWSLFSMAWGIGLAYGLAVAFYQLATYAEHPVGTVVWLVVLVGLLGIVIALLKRQGRQGFGAVVRSTMAT